jgi:hypothetical protein
MRCKGIEEWKKTVASFFNQGIEDNYPRIILSLDHAMYGETFEGVKRYNLVNWLLGKQQVLLYA